MQKQTKKPTAKNFVQNAKSSYLKILKSKTFTWYSGKGKTIGTQNGWEIGTSESDFQRLGVEERDLL